jgi:hypothetical protein
MVQLVAIPPIHVPSFSKWDPHRKDVLYLYIHQLHQNREDYRYKLTIIDHPSLTAHRTKPLPIRKSTKSNSHRKHSEATTNNIPHPNGDNTSTSPSTLSFTYTNAIFLIPAGRETEYMFSSMSGLRSILKSANTARLIAVAFGRNYTLPSPPQPMNEEQQLQQPSSYNATSVELVRDELRYVIQVIASAIPNEVISSCLIMKADASVTFYPFLALNGIGQRNVIDSGSTTCSGRYIVEQCAISISSEEEEDSNNTESNPNEPPQQWVRRLYFLDGNPNVIQSEVHVVSRTLHNHVTEPRESMASDPTPKEKWIVNKSITAFEYHKSCKYFGIFFGFHFEKLATLILICRSNTHDS